MESNFEWIDEVGGSDGEIRWVLEGFDDLPDAGLEIDNSYRRTCEPDLITSKKRSRDEFTGSKSKACREKMRRDKLNHRFVELASILEPGRPPKSDKATILSDTARLLVQLKNEALKLKETNEKLQETIKDLKAEKNELRDEKIKMKEDKDRLELQIKTMIIPPTGFMPHPAAMHAAALPAQGQARPEKGGSFVGYPSIAMWHWLPPAVVDTSQDHELRPPVA